MTRLVGLLLAAGAGRRYGYPKALARNAAGELWLDIATMALFDGGCDKVVVALGACQGQAMIDQPDTQYLLVKDWSVGVSATLSHGLRYLAGDTSWDAAIVHLVDIPDVNAQVISRVSAHANRHTLARAIYCGRPGHPVIIGSDHWAPLLNELKGDEGARSYLQIHCASQVECGDIATGIDIDEAVNSSPGGESGR